MDGLGPDAIATLTLTSGFAFLMTWLAKSKKMLEARQTLTRCPSCGLLIARRGSCRCH